MKRRRAIESPIDHFGYRIRHRSRKYVFDDQAEDVFDVIEVYYDERGAILFWAEPQMVEGDTLDDLQHEIGHMMAAATKPVIEHEDLPGVR